MERSTSQLTRFATGSQELDGLLEEIRAGDNVVFYTAQVSDYLPFVRAATQYALGQGIEQVYVRSAGTLDDLLLGRDGVTVWEMRELAAAGDPVQALAHRAITMRPEILYFFEPLSTLSPWLGSEEALEGAFLTWCPLLFQQRAVAYWDLTRGRFRAATIAAIQDCTQIFARLERVRDDLVLTPLKVWGRYSERMFQPHRVLDDGDSLRIEPLPVTQDVREDYVRALAEKNRELAEIRDALNTSNLELWQRNQELQALGAEVQEQSRLYQSLRTNLDNLLALFQAGWDIGSSLVSGQVHAAIVSAAMRLFDTDCCALRLQSWGDHPAVQVERGLATSNAQAVAWAALREQARTTRQVRSAAIGGKTPAGEARGSVAMAPIVLRRECVGTLEMQAPDARLDSQEARTLLGYLASEASIALDNAYLYHETDLQQAQLRSLLDEVILSKERDSRQLALDLHDGLVQLIVASFQHLQTAQAWRGRDPGVEESEIKRGVQILQQAIYEARRLIGQLRPAGLDDFGLAHALRAFVAQLAAEEPWQVSLDIDPRWGPLPATLEAGLFRIVQEATSNARKYAQAERLHVALRADGDDLVVSVRDWGKGFDPHTVATEPAKGLHIGLVGIRERALLFGGSCRIDSAPGQGATITVRVPRSQATQAAEWTT
jgi:signal transduction histidine kinase